MGHQANFEEGLDVHLQLVRIFIDVLCVVKEVLADLSDQESRLVLRNIQHLDFLKARQQGFFGKAFRKHLLNDLGAHLKLVSCDALLGDLQ
jgi:hypothetical protein